MTRPEPDEIDVPPYTEDMLMDAIAVNVDLASDQFIELAKIKYDGKDSPWAQAVSHQDLFSSIVKASIKDAEQTASNHAWALHHERNDK